MAQPGLTLDWIPSEAAAAFVAGDDHAARTWLARARDAAPPGSLDWARLERLYGLVSIHVLREVEGTFALERADATLLALRAELPTLDWLARRAAGAQAEDLK